MPTNFKDLAQAAQAAQAAAQSSKPTPPPAPTPRQVPAPAPAPVPQPRNGFMLPNDITGVTEQDVRLLARLVNSYGYNAQELLQGGYEGYLTPFRVIADKQRAEIDALLDDLKNVNAKYITIQKWLTVAAKLFGRLSQLQKGFLGKYDISDKLLTAIAKFNEDLPPDLVAPAEAPAVDPGPDSADSAA
jgi:hypothetical protein